MSGRFLSLYTPSTQDADVLESLLVGRHNLVERVVDNLITSIETKAKHHHLLIGPRGIGKTHFVSVVYHRLKARNPSGARVAWIREDPWGMRNFDRFLTSVAKAIAEDLGEPMLHLRKDEKPSEFLDRLAGDGTIVLIAENLDSVFKRIKVEGQQHLRAFIHNEARLVILGTSPSLFDGVTDHDKPLYGEFCVSRLEELTVDEAQDLLARVAVQRGDDELARVIATPHGRQRLRVIQHLAGGHPRLWMLFADCVSIESLDDLVPLFLKALDDLTPYYQERMRDLDGYQEEIVAYLCDERGARTVVQISEACDLKPNAASAQLGKLAEKGYVRRVELPEGSHSGDGRATYFELREPLMRLCLDVKEARGKPIRLIVEFLQAWFEPTELTTSLSSSRFNSVSHAYLSSALGEVSPTVLTFRQMSAPRNSQHQLLEISTKDIRTSQAAEALEWGRLEQACSTYEAILDDLAQQLAPDHLDIVAIRHNLAVTWALAGRLEESTKALFAAVSMLGERAGSLHPDTLIARGNLAVSYWSAGRTTEAVTLFERVLTDSVEILGERHPNTLRARANLAQTYAATGRSPELVTQLEALRAADALPAETLISIFVERFAHEDRDDLELLGWARSNAPNELGSAALASIAGVKDNPARACELARQWSERIGDLDGAQIHLRIAHAVANWATDHDRKHLLALPGEERSIALQLLGLGDDTGS